jgi:hypothetical protein
VIEVKKSALIEVGACVSVPFEAIRFIERQTGRKARGEKYVPTDYHPSPTG